MIAKRIDTKAATSRVARLVKYVVAAQGGIDPRSWTRTADYVLNSGTSSRGEKVGGVRVTNCHTDDPAAATALIECTQAGNTRSKTDKTYHLVFSFPPDEEPTLEVLHAIEDQLCAAIGYADHQRISAVHIDCDHLHVHVAINKVHPKGFQNIEPYFDKKKLMETCERLELEYGLTRTNHGLHGEKPKAKIRDKQAAAEAHSGIETMAGFVSREVSPAIHKAANWRQLHAALAEHGLEIKKRGAGLVIGSGETWVRASQCDRAFSLKGLTDRLGTFEVAGQEIKREPYQPKPRQTHPSSAVLFDQYQSQQTKHKLIRNYGLEQAKYEGAILEANLQKWQKAQRTFVKLAAKGPQRRAMLKMVTLQTAATRKANWRTIEAKRRKVIIDTAHPSWAVWLSQRAEKGDTEALDVLRSRGTHSPMQGDILTAAKSDTAATVILKRYQLQAGTNGVLTYSLSDGGLVIDRKTHVQSFRTTKRSTLLSLELAAKRYKGQALIVEGQADFQKEVARLAGLHDMSVRFADPALERARKAAKPKGKTIINEAEL
jgi:hypothetical protein